MTFEPANLKLKVKRSIAGLGLFTEEEIAKGVCIIEYIGRELTDAEQYTVNSMYLFAINSRRMIDGAIRSNTARYINHSCRPNAEIEIYKGKIFIIARKKINAGEEIFFDYGKKHWNEYIKPKGCRCEKCKEKK